MVGLVDTGATDCLFDRDVADDLGITLADSDVKREYFGVGGQTVIGHVHSIKPQVQGFSEWIEIEVAFINAQLPYQLLGQAGFFDNYEISFQRYRGRFEIKSRHSYIGTRGTNSLSVGGTLKKVVSLKP